MKCPYCDNKINKKDKFCNKCGKKIEIASVKSKRTINTIPIIMFIITGALLVTSAVILMRVIKSKDDISSDNRIDPNEVASESVTYDNDTPEDEENDVIKVAEFADDEIMFDAEEYYSTNAEVLSVTKVDDAKEILDSAEAISTFKDAYVIPHLEKNVNISDGKIISGGNYSITKKELYFYKNDIYINNEYISTD